MYRNATDFCMLILYPAILLNLLVSLEFFDRVFRIFLFRIVSFVNKDNFTPSFPVWMPFISFSCVIALARTSTTMLNKSGESGHTCLVPYLRGKGFSFSPLSMILAVGLSYMAFIVLSYVLSIPNLLSILSWKGVVFCQILFLCTLRW